MTRWSVSIQFRFAEPNGSCRLLPFGDNPIPEFVEIVEIIFPAQEEYDIVRFIYPVPGALRGGRDPGNIHLLKFVEKFV